MYTGDLHRTDVVCRRLLHKMIDPLDAIDWMDPWHDIFHVGNDRVFSMY